jgi:hypothetical protein
MYKKMKEEFYMQVWQNCRVDIFYYDGIADTGEPCEVRIDKDEIVVSYDDEDGPVVYKGKNKGDGHFDLRARKIEGQASLHMSEGSHILEGFWKEGINKGMWRITLG